VQDAPDRERGARSLRTLSAGEHSCRERAVEAEGTQPLGLAEGSVCSRKQSRLGIADSADRDAGRRAESDFSSERSSFYIGKIACSRVSVRCYSLSAFPTRRGYCEAGISVSEITVGDFRIPSGALVSSPNFGAAKRYFGRTAP